MLHFGPQTKCECGHHKNVEKNIPDLRVLLLDDKIIAILFKFQSFSGI